MSQSDLVEIVYNIQTQLNKRGQNSYRILETAFIVNDLDGTNVFDFNEFESILQKAGIFLKRQDLTKFYRYFDNNQNERVNYYQVLDVIRGKISQRRLNIIKQLFHTLDVNNIGRLSVVDNHNTILSHFSAKKHPLVLSGEKKEKDIMNEISFVFDESCSNDKSGYINQDEFIKIYSGISATIPYDDDYFVNIMERVWNIKEDKTANNNNTYTNNPSSSLSSSSSFASPLLQRVRLIFREKVRQKTTSTKSESENLRLNFKYFDIKNIGIINYKQFENSLQRFGIYLDDRTMQQLFNEFDVNQNGTINYVQFCNALYEDQKNINNNNKTISSSTPKSNTNNITITSPSSTSRTYIDTPTVLLSSPTHVAPIPSIRNGDAVLLSATLSKNNNNNNNSKKLTLSQRERELSSLPTVIFLVGGPSCGKTTQSYRIVHEFNFIHININEIIENEKNNTNSLYYTNLMHCQRENLPIPSDIIVNLISRIINEKYNNGYLYYILDGFPLTYEQYNSFTKIIGNKVEVPWCIYLDSDISTMENRFHEQLLICRQQDTKNTLKQNFTQQMNIFLHDTINVINNEFGKEGRLQVINNNVSADAVYEEIRKVIAQL